MPLLLRAAPFPAAIDADNDDDAATAAAVTDDLVRAADSVLLAPVFVPTGLPVPVLETVLEGARIATPVRCADDSGMTTTLRFTARDLPERHHLEIAEAAII
jgi:hypothetical protein